MAASYPHGERSDKKADFVLLILQAIQGYMEEHWINLLSMVYSGYQIFFLSFSHVFSASLHPSSPACDTLWLCQNNYGKSPFLMGKLTISMAIFNSFLYVYQAG